VVDQRGATEQPGLDREGRLVAGFAPVALDGVEDGRLLAADVGAGPAADLDVEGEAEAHHVRSQEAPLPGGVDGRAQGAERPGVLAPQVEVAVFGAGGVAGDGHGLDHGVGVALHQHPVLERAGLRLVGVADQLVGPDRLAGHRRPLPPGWERRPTPADEPRVAHLPDHRRRAHPHRPPQRLVTALRPVVVEAGRVDTPTRRNKTRAASPAWGTAAVTGGSGGGPLKPSARAAVTSDAVAGAITASAWLSA